MQTWSCQELWVGVLWGSRGCCRMRWAHRGASGGQCGTLRRLQGHRMGMCPALAVTGGLGGWWLGGQAVPKMPALD